MQHIITHAVQMLGYAGVFGLMCFFAAELIMPLAGYAAWTGSLTLWGVVLAGTIGSSLGSLVLYIAARYVSVESVHRFVRRYGRWVGLSLDMLERSEHWFDRHAKTSVFFAKFLPALRTAISISAGYRRMGVMPYLACTVSATAVWAAGLAIAGFALTDQYADVQDTAQTASYLALAGVILILAGRLATRQHRSHR